MYVRAAIAFSRRARQQVEKLLPVFKLAVSESEKRPKTQSRSRHAPHHSSAFAELRTALINPATTRIRLHCIRQGHTSKVEIYHSLKPGVSSQRVMTIQSRDEYFRVRSLLAPGETVTQRPSDRRTPVRPLGANTHPQHRHIVIDI